MTHTILQPEGWAPPIGYANGVMARGRVIAVAGQVGWNKDCKFESDELVDQVRQTLSNIVAVLGAAGAKPEHITSLTWYLTDKRDYLAKLKQIGEAYRAVIGRNFPAMTAVQVVALIEDRAKVEIQATAVLPD
ncbi:MAG TPA: RidA family protein [Magnetospirillaceae bacterium]|jgi:enamine deaminase RidA (YjgF/YER057c/UK114 family)